MEVPPGRLEAATRGGKAALATLLSEAEKRKLNGLLTLTRIRDETPARGVVVFNNGNGTLASHTWRETFDGPRAMSAIFRDALSADASLELRTYDHRGSTSRIAGADLAGAHAELVTLTADVEARRARVERDARSLEDQRTFLESRAKEVQAGQRGLEEERKQLQELFASVQMEMEKVAAARREIEYAAETVIAREKALVEREAKAGSWESRLQDGDVRIGAREEAAERLEASLAEKAGALRDSARSLDRMQRALTKRESEVARREEELAASSDVHGQAKRALGRTQTTLDKERKSTDRDAAKLKIAANALAKERLALQKERRELAARESKVAAADIVLAD